jgi:hypothetical protein
MFFAKNISKRMFSGQKVFSKKFMGIKFLEKKFSDKSFRTSKRIKYHACSTLLTNIYLTILDKIIGFASTKEL